MSALQFHIFNEQHRIDSLQQQLHLSDSDLQEKLAEAKKKEDDLAAITKYKYADDVRIRALMLEQERLTKVVHSLRTDLENEVTNTRAAQLETDRMAEDLTKAHNERQGENRIPAVWLPRCES